MKDSIVVLEQLVEKMDPVLDESAYAILSIKTMNELPVEEPIGFFREKEGITVICK